MQSLFCFLLSLTISQAQDFSQGKVLREFPEARYIYALCSTPDDAYIGLALDHQKILILDKKYQNFAEFKIEPYHGGSVGGFSPGGENFVFYKYAEDDTLFHFNIDKRELTYTKFNFIYGVDFPDESELMFIQGRTDVLAYHPQNESRAIVESAPYLIEDIVLSKSKNKMAISYTFYPRVDIYSLDNMKRIDSIEIEVKQPLELCMNDALLAYQKNSVVHIIGLEDNSLDAIFSLPYERIRNLLLVNQGIYITGGKSELAYYDFTSKKLSYFPVNIEGITDDMYQLHNGDILLVIDKKLVLFEGG
ncbi:MAG: hypothetical protein AAFU64_16060 [Bacteroidota bacterium]